MFKIGERQITPEDYKKILFEGETVVIDDQARQRISKSFAFLETFHQDKIIYGINTGLGPMAQYKIDDTDRIKLQYNAIRSHAAGCGDPVDPVYVRAAMITLLVQFLARKFRHSS